MKTIFKFRGFFAEHLHSSNSISRGRPNYGAKSSIEIEAETISQALAVLHKDFKKVIVDTYRVFQVIEEEKELKLDQIPKKLQNKVTTEEAHHEHMNKHNPQWQSYFGGKKVPGNW